MKGHHIYTRAWFEYGSKLKNAGTFTVELTSGIFGDKQDDAIYGKLNPKCAAVPESLAPRNSGKSLLRLYHPYPETTVVSRSWFVTDEITGRGTVPYTNALIFSGSDNDAFLSAPAKAFTESAFEPYKSFAARVDPDAPTASSTKYDPVSEDYKKAILVPKDDWETRFGMNEDVFVKFYISLCRAISGKGNQKVAVILPKGAAGERFMLATLSILPVWWKKKYGAVSAWTGAMDGASGVAIDGMQLVCYDGSEEPFSDARFPVVDLSGAYGHRNIDPAVSDGSARTQTSYAQWLYRHIDNLEERAKFEDFMRENFAQALSVMPFSVVANAFFLWTLSASGIVDFGSSAAGVKVIAESFPKSVSKYPFIAAQAQRYFETLQSDAGNETPVKSFGGEKNNWKDYETSDVQAVCVLAENGVEAAKALIAPLYKNIQADANWENLYPLLSYHAGVLEREGVRSAEGLKSCNTLLRYLQSGGDARCEKKAGESLVTICRALRASLLTDANGREEDRKKYTIVTGVLNRHEKLGHAFYKIEVDGKNVDPAELDSLTRYDVGELKYTPDAANWVWAIVAMAELPYDAAKKEEFYGFLWKAVPGANRAEYVRSLEKRGYLKVLATMKTLPERETVREEISRLLGDEFDASWNEAERDITVPETWSFVGAWLKRLKDIGIDGGSIYGRMTKTIALTGGALRAAADAIQPESVNIIRALYEKYDGTDISSRDADVKDIRDAAKIIAGIDETARTGERVYTPEQMELWRRETDAALCAKRMKYCYDKLGRRNVDWSLAIVAAEMMAELYSFDTGKLLRLCRLARNAPPESVSYSAEDVRDILEAMRTVLRVGGSPRDSILDALKRVILLIIEKQSTEKVFTEISVISAFKSALGDFGEYKSDIHEELRKELGYKIRQRLEEIARGDGESRRRTGETGDVSEEVLNFYYLRRRRVATQSVQSSFIPLRYLLISAAAALALAIFGVFAAFSGGKLGLTLLLGGGFMLWLPFALSALALISAVLSAISIYKN